MRNLIVREFDKVLIGMKVTTTNNKEPGIVTSEDIEKLRMLIDADNQVSNKTAIGNFLSPVKRGVRVNNYVGVIRTESGLTIEILPKIAGQDGSEKSNQKVRQLFVNMLRSLRELKHKTFNSAPIQNSHNHLFEVYIAMYLEEIDKIIKRGLKSSYSSVSANEKYLKGKLNINQHLRANIVDKSSFHVEYDLFDSHSPENRLIKTTLFFLMRESRSIKNKRLIKEQLLYFENIHFADNIEKCISQLSFQRHYQYYEQAINWSKLFLKGKSFNSFSGKFNAIVLLFPMEKVYEAFVTKKMQGLLPHHRVRQQDRRYYLFDQQVSKGEVLKQKKYCLKPDIVVESTKEQSVIIVDTKWKLLDNRGPSQSDLYQMYVYFQRYQQNQLEVEHVILLYPYSNHFVPTTYISESSDSLVNGKVAVKYLDLLETKETVEEQLRAIILSGVEIGV